MFFFVFCFFKSGIDTQVNCNSSNSGGRSSSSSSNCGSISSGSGLLLLLLLLLLRKDFLLWAIPHVPGGTFR